MNNMEKIIKSGGHCYDGTGWEVCPFWEVNKEVLSENKCKLFNGIYGVTKYASESLLICNVVYGVDYQGMV